jgi:hypothetical protein
LVLNRRGVGRELRRGLSCFARPSQLAYLDVPVLGFRVPADLAVADEHSENLQDDRHPA